MNIVKIDNIKILYLEGNDYNRGKVHGELLQNEINKGAPLYFKDFINRLLDHSLDNWALKKIIKFGIDKFIKNSIYKNLKPNEIDLLRGLSNGAKVNYKDIIEATLEPDINLILAAFIFKKLKKTVPNTFGCSSFVALEGASKNSRFYHARNLDFSGIGFWDKYPTILVNVPDNKIPYITMTSAGAPFDITSINKEGIILSIHLNYSTDVSRKGTSLFSITKELMENSTTIEDAIKIITEAERCAPWAYILSDYKNNKACVVESSASLAKVIWSNEDLLLYGNSYISKEHKKMQTIPTHGIDEHNQARFSRMQSLLSESYGNIDAQICLDILADHYDPISKTVKSFGNTISNCNNITSVIFAPKDDMIFVGDGPAPTSLGTFRGFIISDLFNNKPKKMKEIKNKHNYEFPGLPFYIKAHKHWDESSDLKQTIKELKKAHNASPNESFYLFMLGIFLFLDKKIEEASKFFQKSLENEVALYRIMLIKLFLARSFDLLGKRDKAIPLYNEVSKSSFALLKDSANKNIKSKFKKNHIKKIRPLMFFADIIE